MFNQLLFKRNNIGEVTISPKNQFSITNEKIALSPRTFSPEEVKQATENITFFSARDDIFPAELKVLSEFVLKDFFLHMHQTGLYNRQLALWRAVANVQTITYYSVEKRFKKEKEPGIFFADFSCQEGLPSIRAVINKNEVNNPNSFRELILLALFNSKRLKGIVYVTNLDVDEDFVRRIDCITNARDNLSRYESRISSTKDIRLNIFTMKRSNGHIDLQHAYPKV